jgi:hypothetical protein
MSRRNRTSATRPVRAAGVLTISVLWLASSIALGNATSAGCPDSAVRIYVDGVGVITVNGRVVSVADLSQTLSSLKPRPTEVCYSRASAQGEPPPEVMPVIQAIMALRVPVSFYTDKTFKTRVK